VALCGFAAFRRHIYIPQIQLKSAWEEKAPDFEEILRKFAKKEEKYEESQFFASTTQLTHSPQ
jgi:DNA repair exonuclease SbcCD ATPase subunit